MFQECSAAEEPNICLQVEAAGIATSCADAFQTRHAEGAMVLTCGVSHAEAYPKDSPQGTGMVERQNHIAMPVQGARRLASMLLRTVRAYYGAVTGVPAEGRSRTDV